MSRSFYLITIFSLVALMLADLSFRIVIFNPQLVDITFEEFTTTLIIFTALYVFGTVLILKYFHYRKLWFPFWSSVLLGISIPVSFFSIYAVTAFYWNINFYQVMVYFTLVVGLLYGISLIPLKDKRYKFLKAYGLLIVLCEGIFLAIEISNYFQVSTQFLEDIRELVSYIACFIPIYLILHLIKELRTESPVNDEIIDN